MLTGDSGADTIANLASVAETFTLNRNEALAALHDIQRKVLDNWRDVFFYEAGFDDQALHALEHVFRTLPEGD